MLEFYLNKISISGKWYTGALLDTGLIDIAGIVRALDDGSQ